MSSHSRKVVVVTGASSGLGLALSKKFLQQETIVFGVGKTKRNWKTALAAADHSDRFFLKAADLTKESAVKQVLRLIQRKAGRIDLLINCAGYGGRLARVEELNVSEFEKHLANNLLNSFLMCKHTIPLMRKQKAGLIINISSMAGKRAVPKLLAYSAAKFGIVALSQCIAKENSDANLKCITVCPGGMNTKMRAALFGKEDAEQQQSVSYVTDVIMQVVSGKIEIESGGDIIIRHGKITAINPAPKA